MASAKEQLIAQLALRAVVRADAGWTPQPSGHHTLFVEPKAIGRSPLGGLDGFGCRLLFCRLERTHHRQSEIPDLMDLLPLILLE